MTTASVALRILWKEYRVQRGLWLTMAGGCLLLQALVAYFSPGFDDALSGTIVIAVVLSYFYAAGSGATTFALEREEGTQLRSVVLGGPAVPFWMTRFAFGVLATYGLFALGLASGFVLSKGALSLPEGSDLPDGIPWFIGSLTCLLLIIGFAWSAFFSLLVRRVIVALALSMLSMAAGYAGLLTIVDAWIDPRGTSGITSDQFVVLTGVVLLLLLLVVVNQVLAHRWLTTAFFDQPKGAFLLLFPGIRFRRAGLDGGMIVEIGVKQRADYEVLAPEEAEAQPAPRRGLAWLYRICGPGFIRHLRFMRWKEAVETRGLFAALLIGAAGLVAFLATDLPKQTDVAVAVSFVVYTAVLACGVLAFRSEQTGNRFRRLADMGLNPRTVWLSRHCVWLPRGVLAVVVLIVVAVFAFQAVQGSHRIASAILGIAAAVEPDVIHRGADGLFRDTRFAATFGTILGHIGMAVLTLYSIGQAASLVIRSTIVSAFVAFLLGVVTAGWAFVCARLAVPWSLSVLPLAVGCLLFTWLRTPWWMLDDRRLKTWVAPVAVVLVSVAACYGGTWVFRVYEVPVAEPLITTTTTGDGSRVTRINGLTNAERQAVLAPVSKKERETARLYDRAGDLLEAADFSPRDVDGEVLTRWEQLPADRKALVNEALGLTLEAAERPEYAAFSPADVIRGETPVWHNLDYLANLILFDARRHEDDGNLEQALDRCRSALAVARHAGTRGDPSLTSYWISRQVARTLRQLAAHPGFDHDLAKQAELMLQKHRRRMVRLETVQFVTARIERNTIEATDAEIREILDRYPLEGERPEMLTLLSRRFPGEVLRSHRIVDWQMRRGAEIFASYRNRQRNPGDGGFFTWYANQDRRLLRGYRKVDSEVPQIVDCIETTPLLEFIVRLEPVDWLCAADIQLDTEFRATSVIMRLQASKHSTGEFPVELDDFPAALHNPWTNRPFRWYPEGVPGPVTHRNRTRIPADTPFLMAAMWFQATLTRAETRVPEDTSLSADVAPESEPGSVRNEPDVHVEYLYLPNSNVFWTIEPRFWTIPEHAVTGD